MLEVFLLNIDLIISQIDIEMRKVLLVFILSSCSYVSTEQDEITKYPEVADFIASIGKCDSKHYIDKGVIEFYFISEKANYLRYADSVAFANSWETIQSIDSKRVYSKMINSYPADEAVDTLKVFTEGETVKIIWK
jgi:hypothetical protein